MLQNIREHLQGWIAWTIVLVISATFVFWGIESYTDSARGADISATINGDSIPQSQVNALYERLRRQQQIQLGADYVINPSVESELKKQALNQLIYSHVLVKAAQKGGYRVTTSQVDAALLRMPLFQVDGQFSRQRFEEVISSIPYSDIDFINDLRNSMLLNQVQAGFVNSAFALPNDVTHAVKLIDQKRDVAYLIVPIAHFLRDVEISDTVAKEYYQQHQSDFTKPEQVSIEYLELSLAQLSANLRFDAAELESFYKENTQSFATPKQWRVARILVKLPQDSDEEEVAVAKTKIEDFAKRIKGGEDFAVLAKRYSDDKASSKTGGRLNWFSKDAVDPVMAKSVDALTRVGEVSEPFRTHEGFNLIKLLEVAEPQIQPFAKVKSQVSKVVAQQQAGQLFAEQSDKLANLTYMHPNTLEQAAKALSLPVKSTDMFSREGGKADITANAKILSAAFSAEVLGHGNNSDVIELNPDALIVLRIKQHEPATVRPFAEVANTIRNKLKVEEAQKRSQLLANTILKRLQTTGVNGKQLAKQYGFTWQFKPEVGRYDPSLDPAVLNQAFRMPRPAPNAFTSTVMEMPSGGYAVIAVTGVHDGNVDKSAERKRHIFQEEIQNSMGQMDYELYVRDVLKKAKVVVKNS